MSTPYIGQLTYAGFDFAPVNWAKCNGQVMPIDQNVALFQLIGTTYGGDGVTTFDLPNMQSRMPIHQGTGQGLSTYVIGQVGGVEEVTLSTNQIPSHTHTLSATTAAATTQTPTNNLLAAGVDGSGETPAQTPKIYLPSASSTATVNMAAASVGTAGSSLPFSILQPYLTINCIIALFGIFPSQN
jgi:microcystin-dependent protein